MATTNMAGVVISEKNLIFFLRFGVGLLFILPNFNVYASTSLFNVDELRRISYRIGILETPLRYDKIRTLNSGDEEKGMDMEGLTLSNKFGQPYYCSYDVLVQKDAGQANDKEVAN